MMRILAAIVCAYGTLACLEAQAQQEPASPEPSVRRERSERPAAPGGAIGRADANHDGKVSFDELRVLRPRMNREQFDRIDTDADGFLTPADRPRTREPRSGQDQVRRQMLTELLSSDRDGDGAVTYEELAKAKPGFPESTFRRLDADRDGRLTRSDLERPGRREGRPRPPAEGDRAGRTEERRRLMERLTNSDANGDGRITFEEARQGIPGFSEERFRRMDRNGDGVLTPMDRPQRPSPPQRP